MSTIPLYNALIKAGVEPKEAEAAIDGLTAEIKADRSGLATKQDLAEAKLEIIKWVIAIGFIQAGFVVGLLKFTS